MAEALSSTLHELYNDSLQMSNLHSIVIKQVRLFLICMHCEMLQEALKEVYCHTVSIRCNTGLVAA